MFGRFFGRQAKVAETSPLRVWLLLPSAVLLRQDVDACCLHYLHYYLSHHSDKSLFPLLDLRRGRARSLLVAFFFLFAARSGCL